MKNFKKLMKQSQLKRNRKKYFQKRLNFRFEVLNWIYENQKSFKNLEYYFDYPNYAKMPIKMANKIDEELFDRIQYNWHYLREGDCSFKTIMELLCI